MKKIIGAIFLFCMSNGYAGFWAFTMHSRANCVGFNESVSWHFGHSYMLMTYSNHSSTKPSNWWKCRINTPFENTWRSAAYHYAEGLEGDEWTSIGSHYTKNAQGNVVLLMQTEGTDCSGYDGWWDK